MAVRFDAVDDSLERECPTGGAFTLMAWVYITTDRNAYTAFFQIHGNCTAETDTDGTTLALWTGSTLTAGDALSTGTWYHIALVSTGIALPYGTSYVYKNSALNITHAQEVGVLDKLFFGNDGSSEWLNGRIAFGKAWGAALSQSEIQQEMNSICPRRFENLWGWWPMWPGATERLADYSGNGRTLTKNGTLTDEDPPPVSYGAYGPIWAVPAVVANIQPPRSMHQFRQRGN